MNDGLFMIDGEEVDIPWESGSLDTAAKWPIWIKIAPEALEGCEYLELKINSRGKVDIRAEQIKEKK